MIGKSSCLAIILVSLMNLLLLQNTQAGEVTDTRLLNAHQDQKNWLLYGRDYTNQRYSPLDQINTSNVKSLVPKWIYQTGKVGSFQTSPLAVDGVMYLTTPFNHVVALDARTGKQVWRYEHKLRTDKFCCGPANRGAATGYGKVYVATIDSRLIALDQKTGQVVWDVQIANPETKRESLELVLGSREATVIGNIGYTANMAPLVYKGKVIVGTSGAGSEFQLKFKEGEQPDLSLIGLSGGRFTVLRGSLVAYEAQTGKEVWRWHSILEKGSEGEWRTTTPDGEDLHRDIEAEKETFKKYGAPELGGGSIWSSSAVDPELGLLYVGTGNPSPLMDDTTRPGDNLYASSLVALDVETGQLKWYYQMVPHDRWSYDAASPALLFEVTRDGQKIKAVGQAGKTGWFYILDRQTGKLLLKSEPFVPHENLFTFPPSEGIRIKPGIVGGSSWSPVAYSPQTDAVYVSGIHWPARYVSGTLTPTEGKPWKSYTFLTATKEERWGTFTAIQVSTGKILWQKKMEGPMTGGTLATAGGLVFTGEGIGYLNAFDAKTGEILWKFRAGAGVNAPPISYEIDGVQYIAVAVGGNVVFGYVPGDDILVFALPERSKAK